MMRDDDSDFFFFNDTATTEIYTLSLHDALPICRCSRRSLSPSRSPDGVPSSSGNGGSRVADLRSTCCSSRRLACFAARRSRSEEHTSELQSRQYLVCRLLLEKKKKLSLILIHIY